MNKTEFLLQMMERPSAYTDEQWADVLADDKCRELYSLMARTRSALTPAPAVTDNDIDREWQRLTRRRSTRYKVAASLVGLMLLTGISYATIHVAHHIDTHEDGPSTAYEVKATDAYRPVAEAPADSTLSEPRLFENAPLDSIVAEMALYYNKVTDVQNEQAGDIRLYYKWERQETLEHVVDELNHFDRVNIVIDHETLSVR